MPPKAALKSRQWSCSELAKANRRGLAVKKEEPDDDPEQINAEIQEDPASVPYLPTQPT